MSLRTSHRVTCDKPGCHCAATPAESSARARDHARREGFDVGPREIRPGVMQHTDYCPEHVPGVTP